MLPAADESGGMLRACHMPAMPTAAGTRAAWARGAATHSWSFLTKILAGGLFWHFTRRGGLIRQKFQ
jgi:hypothetical protein